MAEIRFTAEERGFLAQAAMARPGFWPAFGSYLPYLAPIALFGGYGLLMEDATAIGLAFLCLLAINLWWVRQQGDQSVMLQALAARLLGETKVRIAADDVAAPTSGAPPVG